MLDIGVQVVHCCGSDMYELDKAIDMHVNETINGGDPLHVYTATC